MNEESRRKRLDDLITYQDDWLKAIQRQHARLALYRDGKLPVDETKIEKIASEQTGLIVAARNINNAILDTVKSAGAQEAREAEVDSFLQDVERLNADFTDRAAWRATVVAADDWRHTAAQIGSDKTNNLYWRQPNVTTTEVLLTLVELLDRHGFTPIERRAVLTHVRTATSQFA
jgi:ParB-like chromosome segregation protein Spo0J